MSTRVQGAPWHSSRYAAVGVSLALASLIPACIPDCRNDVQQRIASPDGRLALVVFLRGCGATHAQSRQVSIVSMGDLQPTGIGNVFVARNERPFDVSWAGPDNIVISHTSTVIAQHNEVAGVHTRYKEGGSLLGR